MLAATFSVFLTMVLILVSVAFFIVLERKGLGVFQIRHGPNKPSLKGAAQAVADGLKLVSKGLLIPLKSNLALFILSPIVLFTLSFLMWLVFPSYYPSFYMKFSVLFFLGVSACNVFGLILAGWSSNSTYSLLGAMRAVAQSISYEVVMAILVFCPFLLFPSFSLGGFNDKSFCLLLMVDVFVLWIITILAETNRAPFDFVEGESELVAGYHVEMGGFLFALIALSEYGSIIFMSVVTVVLFLSCNSPLMMGVLVVLLSMGFVLIRASLPRYRYDMLMDFCWKGVLPLSLCLFMVYLAC